VYRTEMFLYVLMILYEVSGLRQVAVDVTVSEACVLLINAERC
jgi:hypothetical protein